ncbi:MAG: histidine phosphotransferase [Alphaproteobacteria bacterium]|nr:histidine phosphotransferase [Alphaproteobacteria bacterium]
MMTESGERQIPVRVAELLCSRLCHDLISPVAALNNGMELLAEDPADMIGDVADLLAFSAGQASARLQFYRVAYGLGGGEAAALSLPDAARLVRGMAEPGKLELDWPAEPGESIGRDATKLVLNLAALGIEALPRGGRLRVEITRGELLTLSVTGEGVGAGLREEVAAALDPAAGAHGLTARSVQGWFTAWLARAQGGDCVAVKGSDSVTLTATARSAE